MKKPFYSIILPIRNEDESLPQLFDEIARAMRGYAHEIIAVDDASEDTSLPTLRRIGNQYAPLRIIHMPRHLGKWAAIRAGIGISRGDVIVTIDSDLQDNPNDIPRLVRKLHEGHDVVSGWRKYRRDPAYKVVISRLGNMLISLLTKHAFRDLNAPLKAYRREVLMAIPHEGSLLRFSLLFTHKLGYRTKEIPVTHRRRLYGASKFGLVKYVRILYDLVLVELFFSGSNRLTYDKHS